MGDNVTAVGRDVDGEEIMQNWHVRCQGLVCDVRVRRTLEEVIEKARAKWGRIDVIAKLVLSSTLFEDGGIGSRCGGDGTGSDYMAKLLFLLEYSCAGFGKISPPPLQIIFFLYGPMFILLTFPVCLQVSSVPVKTKTKQTFVPNSIPTF